MSETEFSLGSFLSSPNQDLLKELEEEGGIPAAKATPQPFVGSNAAQSTASIGKFLEAVDVTETREDGTSTTMPFPEWMAKNGVPPAEFIAKIPTPQEINGNAWLNANYMTIVVVVMTKLAKTQSRSAMQISISISANMHLVGDLAKASAKQTISAGEAEYSSHMAQAAVELVKGIVLGVTMVASFSTMIKTKNSMKQQKENHQARIGDNLPGNIGKGPDGKFSQKNLSAEDNALLNSNFGMKGKNKLREKYQDKEIQDQRLIEENNFAKSKLESQGKKDITEQDIQTFKEGNKENFKKDFENDIVKNKMAREKADSDRSKTFEEHKNAISDADVDAQRNKTPGDPYDINEAARSKLASDNKMDRNSVTKEQIDGLKDGVTLYSSTNKSKRELSDERSYRDFEIQKSSNAMQERQNMMMQINMTGQMINSFADAAGHMMQAYFGLEKAKAEAQNQLIQGASKITDQALSSQFDAYKSEIGAVSTVWQTLGQLVHDASGRSWSVGR